MINRRTRTIEDLVNRYKRHSDFKDLFVEGEKDVKFYRLIFNYLQLKIKIYKISTVNVPQNISDDLKLGLKLRNCCKNKVITLAYALAEKSLKNVNNQCRCIVDRDFDFFLGKLFSCPILLYTDYNCLEMYVFNELAINKFILSLPQFSISANELINQLSAVLPLFFLFRLTSESLKLGLNWKNFIDNCKHKKCKIIFNFDTFLTKFCDCNRLKGSSQERFIQEIEENRMKLTSDVRNQIHKDDFRQLFIKYIRKCGGITDYNKNSELFPLISCVEINDLKNERMIKDLISWYNKT